MSAPRPPFGEPNPSPEVAVRLLLSIDDSAHSLNISGRHLRDLISRGQVRAVRIGRRVLIPRQELERVAREGTP